MAGQSYVWGLLPPPPAKAAAGSRWFALAAGAGSLTTTEAEEPQGSADLETEQTEELENTAGFARSKRLRNNWLGKALLEVDFRQKG